MKIFWARGLCSRPIMWRVHDNFSKLTSNIPSLFGINLCIFDVLQCNWQTWNLLGMCQRAVDPLLNFNNRKWLFSKCKMIMTGNFIQVNGSLLPASVISLYCAYVCFTGLSSEPRDYVCNGLHNKSTAVTTSTLILGMLTTVLSVLYSALRAGSSTTFLSPPSSPKSGAYS